MTVNISTGLINSMLSDEIGLTELEACYQCHMRGEKTALMNVLITCAMFQAVIPDWAVDELLTLDDRIQSGEVRDLNKFFGFEPEHKATITHRTLKEESYKNVLMALMDHRLTGGNFSAADGLRAVADNTKVPIRIVEEIYKENKDKLLHLSENLTIGETYGVFRAPFPLPDLRRRGRPILKD